MNKRSTYSPRPCCCKPFPSHAYANWRITLNITVTKIDQPRRDIDVIFADIEGKRA